jgi:hypothetical protein
LKEANRLKASEKMLGKVLIPERNKTTKEVQKLYGINLITSRTVIANQ